MRHIILLTLVMSFGLLASCSSPGGPPPEGGGQGGEGAELVGSDTTSASQIEGGGTTVPTPGAPGEIVPTPPDTGPESPDETEGGTSGVPNWHVVLENSLASPTTLSVKPLIEKQVVGAEILDMGIQLNKYQPSAEVGLHFRRFSTPLMDQVRAGPPVAFLQGNFECNMNSEVCPDEDILLVATGWGGTVPSAFQPEQLLMGREDGLRDESYRIYDMGLDLNDPAVFYTFGSSVKACKGDFNKDGYKDIFIVNKMGPHRLLMNKGGYNAGFFTDATAGLHQKDGEGHDMLEELYGLIRDPNRAVPNPECNLMAVAEGQLGIWQRYADTFNRKPSSCDVGDINGDTYPDIVVVQWSKFLMRMDQGGCPVIPFKSIQLFLNIPQNPGNFIDASLDDNYIPSIKGRDNHQKDATTSSYQDVKLHDVDGDGDMDMILAPGGGGLGPYYPKPLDQIFFNNGRGRFENVMRIEDNIYSVCRVPRARDGTCPPEPNGKSNIGDYKTVRIELATINNKQHIIFVKGMGPLRIFEVKKVDGGITLENKTVAMFGPVGVEPVSDDAAWWRIHRSESSEEGGFYASAICDINNDRKPDIILGGDAGLHIFLGLQVKRNGGFTFSRVRENERDLIWTPEIIRFNDAIGGKIIYDIACVDADRDGLSDIEITDAYSWVLANNGDGTLGKREWYPIDHNMDFGSFVGSLSNGTVDIVLTPALRNFHPLARVQRNLIDQVYTSQSGGPFNDISAAFPQPKLENLDACVRVYGTSRENDPDIELCDEFDSCLNSCRTSCAGSVGMDIDAECTKTCSQHKVWEALNYVNDMISACRYCRDDSHASEYGCGGMHGEIGGNFCDQPFDWANPTWQKVFLALREANYRTIGGIGYKGWGRELVEQSIDMQLLNFGGKDYIFVQNQYLPPNLVEVGVGAGTFTLVPPERLPCETRFNKKKVVVTDINNDKLPDLIMPAGSGNPGIVVWINKWWQNMGPRDKLFEKADYQFKKIGQISKVDFIRSIDLDPNDSKREVIASVKIGNERRPMIWSLGDNKVFELNDLLTPAGGRFAPLCYQHELKQVAPCSNNVGRCQVAAAYKDKAPGGLSDITVADFNGDGLDDILESFTGATPLIDNCFQSRVPRIYLRNKSGPGFVDREAYVRYDIYTRFVNNLGVQNAQASDAADFDGDGDIDLLVTDFDTPVYLENLGEDCWNGGEPNCFVDKSGEMLGNQVLFDGKYGAKNYELEVYDFNRDGLMDFLLNTAGHNILYMMEQ